MAESSLTDTSWAREGAAFRVRLILEIFSPVEISLINKYSGSYISSRSVHKINLEYCGIVN